MVSQVSASDAYTDLAGLNAIKAAGRKNTSEGLKQVAQQFEAVFVNMMLKSMRDSTKVFSEGNYLSSNEMDFYQQNFDDQLSLHISQGGGLGLADVLHRQLMHQYEIESSEANKAIGASAEADTTDIMQRQFDSPADFVRSLLPHAHDAAAELGIDPQALLAQSALETGWGAHIARDSQGNSSNNLFGIKADAAWDGPIARTNTVEFKGGVAQMENASFRRYNSYQQSFSDYVEFVRNNPRYHDALKKGVDGEAYAQELQQAGYATDPEYGSKIRQVMHSNIMQIALSESASGE